jgi:hypothetical protein
MHAAMSLVGWSIGLSVWVALGWAVAVRAFVAGRWMVRATGTRLARPEPVAEVIDLRAHRRAQREAARASVGRRAA